MMNLKSLTLVLVVLLFAGTPILAEIFKDAPANCWIGRAPFRGDKYLTQTDVADFRIYTYAISDKDMRQLMKHAK